MTNLKQLFIDRLTDNDEEIMRMKADIAEYEYQVEGRNLEEVQKREVAEWIKNHTTLTEIYELANLYAEVKGIMIPYPGYASSD